MHGITAYVLATLLGAAPRSGSTASPVPAPDELSIEVVEHTGSGTTQFAFVVPVRGSVEAWIEAGDHPRRCEIDVQPVRQALRLRLDCQGTPAQTIRLEATRDLRPGTRTRVAEVTRSSGARSQVFATLR